MAWKESVNFKKQMFYEDFTLRRLLTSYSVCTVEKPQYSCLLLWNAGDGMHLALMLELVCQPNQIVCKCSYVPKKRENGKKKNPTTTKNYEQMHLVPI